MSAAPDLGRSDLVTCPRCRLSFTPAATPPPVAPGEDGPVTIVLDEPAPPAPAQKPTPASMPERIGRFMLRRFIGEGSFGRVYEAYDPTLKRVVALKVAKAEQLGGPRRIARFQREARAAANLMHPNVVAVFDSGQDGGQHYIACAFVAGHTLSEIIAAQNGEHHHHEPHAPQPPQPHASDSSSSSNEGSHAARPPVHDCRPTPLLEVRQVVEVVHKLAEALAYAHKQGVVHRDVKPGNVMLRDDGEPMLMDFGLAARLDETEKLTVDGQFMGTPEYTAPEQWRGEATAASDQYSLGCLLYELLAGIKPFGGGSGEHFMMLHLTQHPTPPRKHRPHLPRDLENVTLKCLEKEPRRRYPDCQALADDLRRWLEGEPVTARRPWLAERAARWGRKNPLLASLAGLLFLGTIALAVVAWWAWGAAADALRQKANALAEAKRADLAEQDALKLAREEKKERDRAEENEKKARENEKKAKDQAERADREAARADGAPHARQMTAALRLWQEHDLSRAEATLDDLAADVQQTWECRHLRELCRRKAMTFRGHAGAVLAVAHSPDGRRLASAGADGTVKVWDARTGQELLSLKGHTHRVTAVAYSPDGQRLASGSLDGRLRTWDARTGLPLRTIAAHADGLTAVAFSPDGSRLASAGGTGPSCKVWDAGTGQELLSLSGHDERPTAVSYSPDGKRLVTASEDGTLIVHDARTGQNLFAYKGHRNRVLAVSHSPDGSAVVSAGRDGALRVWDARSGQDLFVLQGHAEGVLAVAYSPDGKRIVSGGADKAVKVWDAQTGQPLFTLTGHNEPVTAVTYSPDGSRIASGSLDRTLKLWDPAVGQARLTLAGHASWVTALAYSRDGSRVASASEDRAVKVWDAGTGAELLSLQGHAERVLAVAFSPDGKNLVTGSGAGALKVWDLATGAELLILAGHTESVLAVAYSPDGSRIASASADRTLKVWDAKTGRNLFPSDGKGHTNWVTALAYSPDGSRIATASLDRTLRVWDARRGTPLLSLKGHAEGVNALSYVPDGSRIVSGSQDGTLKLWDAKTGDIVLTLKGHTDGVLGVSCSPDGRTFVSASADKTLKLWDVRKGHELLTLHGHALGVLAVAHSPDGRAVVSGGEDRTLRFWDAGVEPDLRTLKGHANRVLVVAHSLDGNRLVSSSEDRTLIVWDLRTGQHRTLTGHDERVAAAAFSRDGSRIISGSEDGVVKVWDANTGREQASLDHEDLVSAVGFSGDGTRAYSAGFDGLVIEWDLRTAAGELSEVAEADLPASSPMSVHGGRRAYADGNLVRIERFLSADEWARRHLGEVGAEATVRARGARAFHAAEAERNQLVDPFAAVFHLDRLLALGLDERAAVLARRSFVLARAKDAREWSSRALARQAVADVASIDDSKALLALLSRHPHAPHDRLYGALLLRTGSVRDAALVLRASMRHRSDDAPIDELLLALALVKLDRRDEARQYLKTAVGWMEQGTMPLTAASLLGARSGGALAALGALAQTPADVRLNPLDPFTAHELASLRAEVETALGDGR